MPMFVCELEPNKLTVITGIGVHSQGERYYVYTYHLFENCVTTRTPCKLLSNVITHTTHTGRFLQATKRTFGMVKSLFYF